MVNNNRLSLLRLALLAACADDQLDAAEQSQLRRVAEVLSGLAGENLALTLRDILLQRVKVEDVAAPLQRPELRLLAYQTAVCICNADSAHSDREHAFLERLRVALALDVRTARSFEREADALTDLPLQPDPARVPLALAHPVDHAALARIIDDYAILNAALTMRADPLALLATTPVQMKMVYRIGKACGRELDRGQIGAMMKSIDLEPVARYVEIAGRQIVAGHTARTYNERTARESSRLAYAQTVALGEVSRRLYCEGISDPAGLHDLCEDVTARALTRFEAVAEEVVARARHTEINALQTVVGQL